MELATLYAHDKSIKVYRIDGSKNEIEFPVLRIRGYPTFYFFSHHDKSHPIEYDGDRSVPIIQSFIETHRQQPLKKESTETSTLSKHQQNRVAMDFELSRRKVAAAGDSNEHDHANDDIDQDMSHSDAQQGNDDSNSIDDIHADERNDEDHEFVNADDISEIDVSEAGSYNGDDAEDENDGQNFEHDEM